MALVGCASFARHRALALRFLGDAEWLNAKHDGMRHNQRRNDDPDDYSCRWLAHGVGLEMPRHVAVTVLIAASIAGLGLAFVAWLRLGGRRSLSLISEK
jgi:hypothetical protein